MVKVVVESTLDWPSDDDELPTAEIQCAGHAFLDYHVRRLQQRSFRHGSSFLDSEDDDDDDDDESVEEEELELNFLDLPNMSHEELETLTFYQILGDLPMHASGEQVKRAYRKACLLYHPDKTLQEDEVFLKVTDAFETLGNVSKRKAYDSTIDFDNTIPKGGEPPSEFYSVYGPVFERNLRFDAINDPTRSKKRRKRKKVSKPPTLGNDDTPMEEVHAFYEYWIHFESWRDFTLVATEQMKEYNVDNAESRYEKRWIQNQIEKKAKLLKKDEMARITLLVERSMAADPRLRKLKIQQRLEKERQAQERRDREAQEQRLQQEQEARKALEMRLQEQQDKKAKAAAKQKKEAEKKQLRKARQSFRKMSVSAFSSSSSTYYKSLEEMNDDVELLCQELDASQLSELTTNEEEFLQKVSSRASSCRHELKQQSQLAQQQRDEARKAEAIKLKEAKQASKSSPWTKDELSALAKAVKKYPAGGANRWETIAVFVNNLCKPVTPRTKEECIEKYNQLANSKPKSTVADKSNNTTTTTTTNTTTTTWTDDQDKQLQQGLAKYPASMDKNERWTMIAKGVEGKSKKECVQRFKAIREAIKNK